MCSLIPISKVSWKTRVVIFHSQLVSIVCSPIFTTGFWGQHLTTFQGKFSSFCYIPLHLRPLPTGFGKLWSSYYAGAKAKEPPPRLTSNTCHMEFVFMWNPTKFHICARGNKNNCVYNGSYAWANNNYVPGKMEYAVSCLAYFGEISYMVTITLFAKHGYHWNGYCINMLLDHPSTARISLAKRTWNLFFEDQICVCVALPMKRFCLIYLTNSIMKIGSSAVRICVICKRIAIKHLETKYESFIWIKIDNKHNKERR